VPKTIFALEPSHEILVLELGTNLPGEIARLTEIAAPDTAIVTRIGPSHLQGLGTIEGVRAEKLSIARGLKPGGTLWVNGDDPLLKDARVENAPVRRVSAGDPGADLLAQDVSVDGEGTRFRVGSISFRLPCLGRHNVLNALLVLGVARGFGMTDAAVAERLAGFRPVGGRLEVRRIEGLTFLDDSYNANPVSFEAALNALAEFPAAGKKIVVAGDMLELGPGSPEFHRALGRRAAEKNFDFFLTAGPRQREAADEAVRAGLPASRVRACLDAAEAGVALRSLAASGDVILVKGSRGMKMETVIACFLPSYIR
jgi:UDP-N-acetylmuramoyl-tripeptide--D-alanyl-D-alanine ligase